MRRERDESLIRQGLAPFNGFLSPGHSHALTCGRLKPGRTCTGTRAGGQSTVRAAPGDLDKLRLPSAVSVFNLIPERAERNVHLPMAVKRENQYPITSFKAETLVFFLVESPLHSVVLIFQGPIMLAIGNSFFRLLLSSLSPCLALLNQKRSFLMHDRTPTSRQRLRVAGYASPKRFVVRHQTAGVRNSQSSSPSCSDVMLDVMCERLLVTSEPCIQR